MHFTVGIFMITAWILLATSAAFFAAWMKPILPNGEWFQVHRALMIASLFVGAGGFIFAFVAHTKKSVIPGLIGFNPNVCYNMTIFFDISCFCVFRYSISNFCLYI